MLNGNPQPPPPAPTIEEVQAKLDAANKEIATLKTDAEVAKTAYANLEKDSAAKLAVALNDAAKKFGEEKSAWEQERAEFNKKIGELSAEKKSAVEIAALKYGVTLKDGKLPPPAPKTGEKKTADEINAEWDKVKGNMAERMKFFNALDKEQRAQLKL